MKPAVSLVAAALLGIVMPSVTIAAITTRPVEYKDGSTTLKGVIAYDDAASGKKPGVLVVPEWWGVNEYPISRAKQLAELGYVAFVADIYGDGFTTADPNVAGQKAGEAKQNNWLRTRGKLALDQLAKDEHVDGSKLAAIGYCFGGGTVLEMARDGDDLKGVVSFHGTLATDKPAQKGAVKAKVLVLNGDADAFVPKEQVQGLDKEMKDAGVDIKTIGYPGAKHAFTNPKADTYGIDNVAYNKEADEKSWDEMKRFLADVLK